MTVMMNQWMPTDVKDVRYMVKGNSRRAYLYLRIGLPGELLDTHTSTEVLYGSDFERTDEEMARYIYDKAYLLRLTICQALGEYF